VCKLVWFLVLFIAGLVLLVTVPEGTLGPASALEESRHGDIEVPFELSLGEAGKHHQSGQGGGQ
jgi:hypothetical protein